MIMTPEVSVISIEKQKILVHPNWQPYAFGALELEVDPAVVEKNEYAKFRTWLIDQEKKFVQKELEKLQLVEANKPKPKEEEKDEFAALEENLATEQLDAVV